MKITDIKPQAKNENRVSVFIDDKFSFGIDRDDCSFMGLKAGEEITEEKYNYIVDNVLYEKAYKKADRFIGFKMRTEKEVRKKLEEEGFTDEITEKVIATLIKYKYIDDENYALLYARDCASLKKWGSQRIKSELIRKGVDIAVIERALENAGIEEDTEEIIDSLLEKRIKTVPIDAKEKQKQFSFLLRKGFRSDDIRKALRKYTEEDD